MLDLTAGAASNGVKFDGVDLFLFDPHVSIDSTDDDLKRLRDKIAARGFVVGSLVAPVWPPTGGGSAMGSADDRTNFVDAGPQGVRDRQEAEGPRHSSLRRRPHRLGVEPERVGEGSGRQHEEDRRDLRRGVRRRRELRRDACRRRRDLLGRHAQLEAHDRAARDGGPSRDARLPGRHGAHAALHDGLQRAGGSHPAGRLRLEGSRAARSGPDSRSPMRCGRGPTTSTSRRTTRR